MRRDYLVGEAGGQRLGTGHYAVLKLDGPFARIGSAAFCHSSTLAPLGPPGGKNSGPVDNPRPTRLLWKTMSGSDCPPDIRGDPNRSCCSAKKKPEPHFADGAR